MNTVYTAMPCTDNLWRSTFSQSISSVKAFYDRFQQGIAEGCTDRNSIEASKGLQMKPEE